LAGLARKWQAKQICKDKTTGPKWHLSGFVTEFGNGVICTRPDRPPPPPIHLKELDKWYEAHAKGEEVELPPTADVWMRPGKNHDGWWLAEQFWKQCHLAIAIWKHIFSRRWKRLQIVLVPDWSQNHAAMSVDGRDAENMLVNPGGATARHIRHTFIPKEVRTRSVGRRIVPILKYREPLCPSCTQQEEAGKNAATPCRLAFDEHGRKPGFQNIGHKGLRQVLEERGLNTTGLFQPGLIEALQNHSDFAKRTACERAHVTDIFAEAGHLVVFGIKYHSDFAHCERKWMFMKDDIRKDRTGESLEACSP